MSAPAGRALAGPALRWMILGEWRARPLRLVMAALAIAVGVALGFAVHLINASALAEFSQAVRAVNGDADLQVRALEPSGFDEALYPRLARLPGAGAVSPAVELAAAGAAGARASFTLIGLDIFRAGAVTPGLIGRAAEAGPGGGADDLQAFDERALFLSDAALEALGARLGGEVEVTAGGRSARLVVAGTLPAAPEGRAIGVIDIAAAQWRFGMLGRLNRIDVKLPEGGDLPALRQAVRAALPAGAEITDPDAEARRSDSMSRAYRVNLNMLALMALLTGGFLVYSAQALSVARRRPQFALVRVLGARPSAVLRQVMIEAGVLGAAGAALGLGLGLALAAGALQVLGGDLGGGYFDGVRPRLIFAPGAAAVFFGLGAAAALAGGLLPAREAAAAEPALALKNLGDQIDPRRAPGWRLAALLLVLGAGAAFLPAVGGVSAFGYLSIALLLAGGVAAMPRLARLILEPLQRVPGAPPALDLALKRLWGAPSQAAVALCGLVASTSLMIAMAVMVTSFRGSVEDWLVQALPADLYVRVEGAADGSGFDPDMQARLAAVPGVARIAFSRTAAPLKVSPDRPPVALVARPLDPADPGATLPLVGRALSPPPGVLPVWPSEPAALTYGWRPGRTITLPLAGGTEAFVAGVWRDYARQQGAVVLAADDYSRLTGDLRRSEAAVTLAEGAGADAVVQALRDALPPELSGRIGATRSGDLRRTALRIFDRSFMVTYALEAVAVLVGLMGVAATVSAQTLARAKEFGMLRHLGVRRGQVLAMLAAEGALLGAVGMAAGVLLGLAMSQVLIHVVNPQSFHWTMDTRLPLGLTAVVALCLVAASAGAALLSGRRAVSGEAVRAVREDW